MTLSEAADDRREIVDRYFARMPSAQERARIWLYAGGGAAVIVVGVLLTVAGPWLLGIAVIALGGVGLARGLPLYEAYRDACEAALPKPRDAIIDKIRDHELAKVRRRALERLDLTAEDLELAPVDWDPLADAGLGAAPRDPLVVTGPVPTSRATLGGDGVWRFSRYAVLVLCPTDYHLALYRCVIDLRVAGLFQEETHEYHYADVVAVLTAVSDGSDLPAEDDGGLWFEKVLLHEFQLVVASGDRTRIVFGISDERHPDQQLRLPPSGIDNVVRTVRTMLRDKKAA
ncbi:hypothetical protein [Amycolatopsis vancoresmycina]|uniref:DUF3137 domain-containing protein n=1 Tax=Amycolatopsis vancoresmycina DSM 44592 TaxID=1292037 RepID=R1HYA0_9PSEU|nr:hypothetical protein [Amycolatopsis vancoresmycina]EOD63254.1 hypothetical protein H480_38035 [Amycolatopsis vancoresmycina DSM 44592]